MGYMKQSVERATLEEDCHLLSSSWWQPECSAAIMESALVLSSNGASPDFLPIYFLYTGIILCYPLLVMVVSCSCDSAFMHTHHKIPTYLFQTCDSSIVQFDHALRKNPCYNKINPQLAPFNTVHSGVARIWQSMPGSHHTNLSNLAITLEFKKTMLNKHIFECTRPAICLAASQQNPLATSMFKLWASYATAVHQQVKVVNCNSKSIAIDRE